MLMFFITVTPYKLIYRYRTVKTLLQSATQCQNVWLSHVLFSSFVVATVIYILGEIYSDFAYCDRCYRSVVCLSVTFVH